MIIDYTLRFSLLLEALRTPGANRAGEWPHFVEHMLPPQRLADVLKAVLFGVMMRRRAIKELGLVKRMVGA